MDQELVLRNMPWRFSEAPEPRFLPYARGRLTLKDRVGYDECLGRYRWIFGAVLEQARARAGGQIGREQAVAAVLPEVQLALSYIDAAPPNESIFGYVWDIPSRALPSAESVTKAEQSRKQAEMSAKMDTSPDTPDWQRGGFTEGAIEILKDALRTFDPNGILAAVQLVRYLEQADRPLEALAEWCDVYCRAISLSALVEKVGVQNLSPWYAAREAYGASLRGGFVAELQSTAKQLKAENLCDPVRIGCLAFPDEIHRLFECSRYTSSQTLNWLINAYDSPVNMTFYAQGPGSIQSLQNEVQTLFRFWRNTRLRIYPQCMRDTLLKGLNILERALTMETRAEVRAKIGETLGVVPLMETIQVLQKYRQDPDSAVRAEVDKSILAVGKSLSFQS